jgi:hypothetical protein
VGTDNERSLDLADSSDLAGYYYAYALSSESGHAASPRAEAAVESSAKPLSEEGSGTSGTLPLRSDRGGAGARAAASYQPYRRIPSLPEQCTTCLRYLNRDRMSVMAVGAEPTCALCLALSVVEQSVPTTEIAAHDEEEVIRILSSVNSFLRRPRQMS